MAGIKIPGADQIQDIAPTRDPGVQANPNDFGAQIGTSTEHFGDALSSLGAHLYQKLQTATADAWVQTNNIDSAAATQQAIYDNRAAFPKGDADGGTASQDDLNARLAKADTDAAASTTAKLGQPTAGAQARTATIAAGRAADARVQSVTYGHNQQVIGKQTVLDDNVKTIASSVLSGGGSVEDGLKQVDANAASGTSLYSASQLADAKEKWQQAVIDAGIKSRYDAGDKAGGDALAAKYYGAVPHAGDSNAANAKTAMDYFISTGKTKEQAAGIVGNLIHESNLNTTASGDAGTAFGIAQWRGERQVELRAFAKSKGTSPNDFQTQLEFINQELNTSESAAHAQLLGAKTTKAATMAFINYERPKGVGTANPDGLSNRLAQANAQAGGPSAGTGIKIANADGTIPASNAPDNSGDNEPVLPDTAKASYWRTQSNAVGVDIERQDKIQKIQAQKQSDSAENETQKALEAVRDSGVENPQYTVRAIGNNDNLNLAAKARMKILATAVLKDDPIAKVSQDTSIALVDRIRLSDDDPDKIRTLTPIYDAYHDGKLSQAGLKFVRDEFVNAQTPEGEKLTAKKADFMKRMTASITKSNPLMGKIDQSGDQQMYRFENDVADKVDEYRQTPGKHWQDLFNPSKPDYLGAPKALEPYQKTMEESVASRVQTLTAPGSTVAPAPSAPDTTTTPAAPQKPLRNPGESPAAYLARIGSK
jgi:hypothetical protein